MLILTVITGVHMKRTSAEREAAIRLRQNGATLLEIAAAVNVSKSLVSLWIKNVTMTEEGVQRHTQRVAQVRAESKARLVAHNQKRHEEALANPQNRIHKTKDKRKYDPAIGNRQIKRNACRYCGEPCINKFCSVACRCAFRKQETRQLIESGACVEVRRLKAYLMETRGCKCELCQLSEWFGKPMNLVIDHIDGNSDNDKLDNVRLICNNCDSYLPTYKSRNTQSKRIWRRIKVKEAVDIQAQ